MKKLCIYPMLLFLAANSFAQIKNGSKALTSTISFFNYSFGKGEASSSINPTFTSKSSGFSFMSEITYGEIKENHLFSYGLSLGYGFDKQSSSSNGTPNNSKNHRYAIGPAISYQKFYILADRLYYSPFSKLGVVYRYSKQDASVTSSAAIQKGIEGTFEFHPFSVTFSKNAKTNFLFTIGTVWFNYTRTKSYYRPVLYNSKTISNMFTASAQIAGIGFGIQKLF